MLKNLIAVVLLVAACPVFADVSHLALDVDAIVEAVPLVMQAIDITAKAEARERAHKEQLRKRGIAEVEPTRAAVRYTIDTAGVGNLLIDDWGELYIDRRFVTDEEMKVVHQIEAFVARYFSKEMKTLKAHRPRRIAGVRNLPVFRGFEDERYQRHDALIAQLVEEFNANKASASGGTSEQAAKIADLTAAMVKSHMIEESGGNGPRSLAAWQVDPLQVNVPGDWGEEKELVGLEKPSRRNEGSVENNIRAAIRYLSRKGFSSSARPAAERPKGYFDGWLKALRRYNGRRDRTDTDRYYSDEYADKIVLRASDPDRFVPIEIRLKKE